MRLENKNREHKLTIKILTEVIDKLVSPSLQQEDWDEELPLLVTGRTAGLRY